MSYTTSSAKSRRIARVRARVTGTNERPRLAVARSLKHVSAQIINDATGQTLVAVYDRELAASEQKLPKLARATAVGKLLAERAKAKGVTAVVFDRRDKRFHGRIRALAEGAREGGLNF